MPALFLATFVRRARGDNSSEGPRRIRFKLAKLAYDDLRGKHLVMVEATCRETHVSYRIFGILVKFDPCQQSLGYPDFDPDIHILEAGWYLEAYQALVHVPRPVNGQAARDEDGELIRAPWTAMFHDIVFYFREVRDLNAETLDGIKDYVDFMRVNAKTWWEILHWLTISFLSRDATDTDASRDLYAERRRDVKRLWVQYEALLKRLFAIAGFPKTLLYEPCLWTLPGCVSLDPQGS
ncbi:hypothetical protein PHMEG_00023593 [Phytophthora megakarya]|uniref:Uncharacterized protein n=1 Tax=Phytophthora megakarya TaxID=4795 RepID=A0A225VHA9_9STRA|nr:hypothetical protein PHMEG_00023593 [Phytophthora megakarya]